MLEWLRLTSENERIAARKLRQEVVNAPFDGSSREGGKQQNCVKPHICFKRGRWQMDGWYEGNLPHIAYCHADWKTAREYFRSVLRCR